LTTPAPLHKTHCLLLRVPRVRRKLEAPQLVAQCVALGVLHGLAEAVWAAAHASWGSQVWMG